MINNPAWWLDFLKENGVLIVIGLGIVAGIIYKHFKDKKGQMINAEPPESKPEPSTAMMDLDMQGIDPGKMTNLQYLKTTLKNIDDEIKEKKATYNRAKEHYENALSIEKSLRTHIPFLEKQRNYIKIQIGRIKDERKTR